MTPASRLLATLTRRTDQRRIPKTHPSLSPVHRHTSPNKPISGVGKPAEWLTLLFVHNANPTLKRTFILFIVLILLSLIGGTWLAMRALGKIEEVRTASSALDERTLGFSPKFRSSVYQIQALALRTRISNSPEQADNFEELQKDLRFFVSSQKEIFDHEEERLLYSNLISKLDSFLAQLRDLIPPRDSLEESESLTEILDHLKELDEAILRLGSNSKSENLRQLLQRCQVRLLMVHARKSDKQATLLSETLEELILQATPSSDLTESEQTGLQEISRKLTRFKTECLQASRSWIESGSPRKNLEDFEKILIHRDAMIELADQLTNLRRSSFKQSLASYQATVDGLGYFALIAVGLIILFLLIAGWLARSAFLKPMEAHLAQTEKSSAEKENLATIGTVASGIAHEIRNPITTIKARLFALTELIRGEESQVRQVEAIQNETLRMERIVQGLLTFARPAEPSLEKTSMAEFVDQVHETLAPEILSHHLSFDIKRNDEADALIDPDQIRQVLHNLVRNAIEACPPEGGEIHLSSERHGNQLKLSVSDNGSGIPVEHQARIFEPFFSKKKAGTGLGLAISRNIVASHHGTLTFESDPENGTTFTITLDTA